jgi:hypothetical protein
VDGQKWITNGHFADYFTTAVRTGGPGMSGLSLLLIERSEGLTTKPIKTCYSPAAGTSLFRSEISFPVSFLACAVKLLLKQRKGIRSGILIHIKNQFRGLSLYIVGKVQGVSVDLRRIFAIKCWEGLKLGVRGNWLGTTISSSTLLP